MLLCDEDKLDALWFEAQNTSAIEKEFDRLMETELDETFSELDETFSEQIQLELPFRSQNT